MPITVVADEQNSSRYVVMRATRDCGVGAGAPAHVQATVCARGETEALLLAWSLRCSRQECARFKQGWLLSDMGQHSGWSLEELARRFDHGLSWFATAGSGAASAGSIQQQMHKARSRRRRP
jgi:hypothetical protein